MANTLSALSVAFRAIKAHSAHRELGLRALKDAKALGDRNPARVEELLARASYHLPYAEAAR
jgi:hypothetical protein